MELKIKEDGKRQLVENGVYVLDCPCCKNIGNGKYPEPITCNAYPIGIPDEILFSSRVDIEECANGYGYKDKYK